MRRRALAAQFIHRQPHHNQTSLSLKKILQLTLRHIGKLGKIKSDIVSVLKDVNGRNKIKRRRHNIIIL